ncbi:MAG: DUF58 domain-containing protein [Jatrophihabitans sp.]|uniref:DUF58 domain-containing protein n=1 Tax=Jatrophihabitans sp. TaxID=1932789 RepID=UPI003F7E62A8
MVITGRLVLLAAVGAVLAAASAGLAVGWLVLLVLAVLADLVLAARITDLRFTRSTDPSVSLGGAASTVLEIGNEGRRRWRGRVRDAWVPSTGAAPRTQPVAVPPGERRRVATTLTPTRRGERRAVVVAVRSVGPLGLAARQRRVAVPGALRVLPAFPSRRLLPEKLARLRLLEGAVPMRVRGRGSEFDSLRTYVLGDDVRSIDWRATARSRDVVVRTWRPERERLVVLVVDTGRFAAGRLDDGTRLDAALDAALLLASVVVRAGDRIALVAADVTVRARVGAAGRAEALRTVMDALARLEPALVETDPNLLATQVLAQVGRRSLVVVLGSIDPGGEAVLVPALRPVAARHEVVVASVADPAVGAMTRAHGDADEVYAAAAAEVALAGRRAVAAALRGIGVSVVDRPPESFASAVTDAYLELKAAGRL